MASNVINFNPNLNAYLPVNGGTQENEYIDKMFSLINNQPDNLERLKKSVQVYNHLNGIIKKENRIITEHQNRINQILEDINSLDSIIRESDSKTHEELTDAIKEFNGKYRKLNISGLNTYDKGTAVNSLRTIKEAITNREKELSCYLYEHQRRLNICEDASASCQGILGLLKSGRTPQGMVDRTVAVKKPQAPLAAGKGKIYPKGKRPAKKKPEPPKDDNFGFKIFHERDRDTGEKITGYTNWDKDSHQLQVTGNAGDLWTEDGATYAKDDDGEPVRVRSAKSGYVQDELTGAAPLNHKVDESASAVSTIFDSEADEWVSLEKYTERQALRKQSQKENLWAENYNNYKTTYDGWVKYIYADTGALDPEIRIQEEFARLKTAYEKKVAAIYVSADKRIEIKISGEKLTATEIDVKGRVLKSTEYLTVHDGADKTKFRLSKKINVMNAAA